MTLDVGSRLGPYEILAELGRGGMGEVYRARDSRLGREVAIKVLPASFANDIERRMRFEREAQAVAALSHPNVIAIFDTGAHEGQVYVVMELLAGETLRDRLTSGSLPVRKAVETAVQIARGLSAAHDKGVVHRDLKPENVFLLADGQVKILDFGLAQQMAAGSGATETVAALTGPGTVMGTVGYMAPEQVRGQPTDARTDLFALGALLYEMLSGQRAFRGETSAETMTAILREDPPDLGIARTGLSPSVDRIVRHCIEKNPPERFQSARDVAFALEALSGSGASASGQGLAVPGDNAPRRGAFSRTAALPAAIAGVVLVVAAFAGGAWWSAPKSEWATEWIGHDLGGSPVAFAPRISPDGKDVAFQAMSKNLSQVAVMNPDSGSWRMLTTDPGVGQVAGVVWSNDGSKIWFWRTNESPRGVFSVTVPAGDEIQYLKDAASPREMPDGDLLVCRINADGRPQLYRVRRETQKVDPLNALLTNKCYSTFRVFPDGREAVFYGRPADAAEVPNHLYVIDLTTGKTRLLATNASVFWNTYSFDIPLAVTPDGRWVVFAVQSGDQFRIVATTREASSGVQTLFTVGAAPNNIDVARDGAIYADQVSPVTEVARISAGGEVVKLAELPTLGVGATPLPDGRILADVRTGGARRLVVLTPGREPTPFVPTLDEETVGPHALLGPDHVVFLAGPEGKLKVAVASVADGFLVRRLEGVNGNEVTAMAGSPDGKTVFYVAAGVVWSVAAEDGQPRKIRRGDFVAVDPKGQYLIIQANEKDTVRLVRVPLPAGAEVELPIRSDLRIAPDAGLAANAISPDGRVLVRTVSPESWFWTPAILDQKTGTLTSVMKDRNSDLTMTGWNRDGDIIGITFTARSRLWRFRPVR